MLRTNKKIRLEKLLTRLGATIVGVFFVLTLGIQALSSYRTLVLERQNYQDTISKLIFDSIRQPLLQGSFFEAKSRLQAVLERAEVDCIQLQLEGLKFEKCRTGESSELRWYSVNLAELKEFSSYSGNFKLGFDQTLVRKAFQRQLVIILIIAAFGALLVRILISAGAKLFQTEVKQLTTTLSQEGPTNFSFRTYEFSLLYDRVEELFLARKKLIEHETFANMAKSVVHDIRSPLSTLKVIAAKGMSVESVPLLKAATARLEGIANNLLDSATMSAGPIQSFASELVTQANELIKEYRTREPQVQLYLESFLGLNDLDLNVAILPVPAKELNAILDNLLKNSCEVRNDVARKIWVRLKIENHKIVVEVQDNGPGIKPDVLGLLGKAPVTHGKTNGKGIGLYLIFKKVESWGSNFSISSLEMGGALARLEIGLLAPEVGVGRLTLYKG